jgi:hypothetical protein
MSDSSTGGYLIPKNTVHSPYDDTLEDDLADIVAGITALPRNSVRPRFQEEPPPEPPRGTNWCAVGPLSEDPEGGLPSIVHHGEGDGEDELRTHPVITVMASFYGPQAYGLATLLRDGLYVSQNHEYLYKVNMGIVDTDAVTNASELVNAKYRKRFDLTFRVRRLVERHYPVLNIAEAGGTFMGGPDGPSVDFHATEDE